MGSAQDKIGVGESVWLYFSNLIKIKIKKHKNVSFTIDKLDMKCYNMYTNRILGRDKMRKILKTLICALLAFGIVGCATACEMPEFLQNVFNGDDAGLVVPVNPDDDEATDDETTDDETTDDETTDDETSKDSDDENKGWTKPY